MIYQLQITLLKALQATFASPHDNIIHQDTYSKRDNLLFEKVPEIEGELCTEVICQIFVKCLKLDVDQVAQIKLG